MAQLSGLTAIAGYQVQIDENAQASPEERLGGTADPRHAIVGEQARPYSWESKAVQTGSHGPYGPESQLLSGDDWLYFPAGTEADDPAFDRTPSRRAAPFPKGINSGPVPGATPDDIADQLIQSRAIHAISFGGSLKSLTALTAKQDQWEEIWDVSPGHSDQVPIPKQLMSSGFMYGTRDRVQSMARQNEYGFDSAHKHRRIATGPIPGNTMWMKPGGRPMRKTLAGPARPPIGPTSPFGGQDLGAAFGPDGAVLQNVPTEYVAPPTPNLAAPAAYSDVYAPVEWY